LCLVPVVFLVMFVRPSVPTDSGVSFILESTGYVFLLAGLAIRMWSILYVGGRKSRELVTEGPYSICRNPLYVGTFFLAIGAGLCFENLPLLAATVAVILPVHLVAAKMEEHHLQATFPVKYPQYRRRVPRFWPRFHNYRSQKTLVISVHAIRRATVDAVCVLLIPLVEDFLEILHQYGVVPVLWRFP